MRTSAAILFILITFVCIFVLMWLYHVLPRMVRYVLPESGLILLVGIFAGIGLRQSDLLGQFIVFDPEIFFAVLLPPIIFYAGYSLEKEHGHIFFSNIGSILTFAVFGTIISTVVVSMLCYAIAVAGVVQLTLIECWLFGALISAIDPVATIAIFEAFHVENTLFNLVFGESVLNDAVAIVLYRTVSRFTQEGNVFNAASFFYAVAEFCWISLGSLGIGLGFGIVLTITSKFLHLRGDLPTLWLLMLAYLSYICSELATLSGIMTVLSYGIFVGHYGFLNLDASNKETSYAIARILGVTFESFVFAYIGMSTFGMSGNDLNVGFVALAFLFCLVGRALNTFPLSFLLNRMRKRKVPFKTQFVIWFSGLRGAIAFALSLDVSTENRSVIRTTTLAIVLITTFLIGGGTLPILEFLGIVGPSAFVSTDEAKKEKEAVTNSKMWFLRFDRAYLTPFFCIKDQIPNDRRVAEDRDKEETEDSRDVEEGKEAELTVIGHARGVSVIRDEDEEKEGNRGTTADPAPADEADAAVAEKKVAAANEKETDTMLNKKASDESSDDDDDYDDDDDVSDVSDVDDKSLASPLSSVSAADDDKEK